MNPASFDDIAIQLVAENRARAQFQARDIAERLALGSYTPEEGNAAIRAREALIRELIK